MFVGSQTEEDWVSGMALCLCAWAGLTHQQSRLRALQPPWDIRRPWQEQLRPWQELGAVAAPRGGSVVIPSKDSRGQAPYAGTPPPLGCCPGEIADITLVSGTHLRGLVRHLCGNLRGETEVKDLGYLKSTGKEILHQSLCSDPRFNPQMGWPGKQGCHIYRP